MYDRKSSTVIKSSSMYDLLYNRNLGIDLPKLYVLEYYIWTFKLLQNFTEFKFFTTSFLQFGTESFRVTWLFPAWLNFLPAI